MNKVWRTSTVLREVGNPHLSLHKGEGYWYFVYDDEANGVYETHSVYTLRLSDLTLKQWVEEAEDLLSKVR